MSLFFILNVILLLTYSLHPFDRPDDIAVPTSEERGLIQNSSRRATTSTTAHLKPGPHLRL